MLESEVALLGNYLIVGALVFSIGLVGFLARRNLIVMFHSVEMMLQGISISLVAWGRFHNDWGGQMLVIFIITVAACEAGIGLALILSLYKYAGSLDVTFWQEMREDTQPAYVDHEIPEETEEDRVWPKLTPAGIEPELDEEDLTHRSQV